MATDVFDLEADSRPSVALPVPLNAGTGDAVEFENMGRVTLRIAARPHSSRPRGTPSLTVTVEDSPDGESWSTLSTFTFTAGGTQTATVDSPDAFLRASWSVSAGAWSQPSVGAVPFASGASDGGGSLPAGGEAKQVLTKLSVTDGDADWAPPSLLAARMKRGVASTATDVYLAVNNPDSNPIYDEGGYIAGGDHTQFVAPVDGLYLVNSGFSAQFNADPGTVALRIVLPNDGSDENNENWEQGSAQNVYYSNFLMHVNIDGQIRLRAGETVTQTWEAACENSVLITLDQQGGQFFSIVRLGEYPETL